MARYQCNFVSREPHVAFDDRVDSARRDGAALIEHDGLHVRRELLGGDLGARVIGNVEIVEDEPEPNAQLDTRNHKCEDEERDQRPYKERLIESSEFRSLRLLEQDESTYPGCAGERERNESVLLAFFRLQGVILIISIVKAKASCIIPRSIYPIWNGKLINKQHFFPFY